MMNKSSLSKQAKSAVKTLGKAAYQTSKTIPVLNEILHVAEPVVKGAIKTRRRAKRRIKEFSSSSTTSAPVAIGTEIVTVEPTTKAIPGGTRLTYTIAPGDLRPNTALYGGTNFLTDPSAYRVWEFRLTPLDANVYQVLPDQAKLYKKFRFQSFNVRWLPTVSTTTTGKIGVLYQSNAFTPIQTNFLAMANSNGNSQHSLWTPFVHQVKAKKLQGDDPDRTYNVNIVPPRRSSGDYGDDIPPEIIASLQGSFIIGIEGLGSSYPLSASIGTMYVDLVIDLMESTPPLVSISQAISQSLDVDFTLPFTAATAIKNVFWRRSASLNNRYYYVGTRSTFALDVTVESTNAFPLSLLSFFNPSGVVIPPDSTNSFWIGTTTSGLNVAHFDGVQTIDFGDYIEIGVSALTDGVVSLILGNPSNALVSRFA